MKTLTRILLKRLSRAARPYLRWSGLLQVSGVYNHSAMVWEPGAQKVLVLAPHMDDETIGCGGTLALHAQRGAQITVMFLTDGRNGSSEVNMMFGKEREQRQKELIETRTSTSREWLGSGPAWRRSSANCALFISACVTARRRCRLSSAD